jgi:hypothetical protein
MPEISRQTMDRTDALDHVANGIAYNPMLLQPGSDILYTHDYHFDTSVFAAGGDTGYGHQARDL